MRTFRLCFLILGLLLLPLGAQAAETAFTVTPQTVYPGRAERISFFTPADGQARIEARDGQGNTVAVIRAELDAYEGVNHLTWDGLGDDGYALVPGDYVLYLILNGAEDEQPFTVGEECPSILSVRADSALEDGKSWSVTLTVSLPGALTMRLRDQAGAWRTVLEAPAEEGKGVFTWDGLLDGQPLPMGNYAVQMYLTDESGISGSPRQIMIARVDRVTPAPIPTATPMPTPAIVIPSQAAKQGEEDSYWTLPVGVMDEEKIWEIMMQPITVIDGKQTEVYRLRKTPDASTARENIVGEITYASQGVHILERGEEWTLVEAFNSSYGPKCNSRPGYGATDELIRGYVKTSLLKTIQPKDDYGLLIDKLEQKMYIFSAGKCIGTLLVSTGQNTDSQPWNETPSGEFLMVSRMGGFPAGNLYCPYGMRINGGCAVHEVPYKGSEDTPKANRDYSITEKYLGKKASHGCVRVQKDVNDQGQNMKWLWNNIKVNTKVLIWDDTGRWIPYPDDQLSLYYNPNGGQYYHEDQYCSSVKSRYLPLTAFPYAQLDTHFGYLAPCPACVRNVLRKAEIDAINQENINQK